MSARGISQLLSYFVGEVFADGSAAAPADAVATERKKVEEFLAFAQSRMDRSHTFFRDFRLDNQDSIVRLKNRIAAVAGIEKAENILIQYVNAYLKEVPLNWESVFDYKAVGEVLMKEAQNSKLWRAGSFVHQKAMTFLERRDNRQACPEDRYDCDQLYKQLESQNLVARDYTLIEKVGPRLASRGVGYTIGAMWRNVKGKALGALSDKGFRGIDSKYFEGELKLKELSGALPGFVVAAPHLNSERLGTLILGDPKEGARVKMRVNVGGGVSEEKIRKDFEGRLQYQGVVTMQSGYGVPLGTVAVNGFVHQQRFDATRLDGYIIVFSDNTMRIIDQRLFRLSDITRRQEDAIQVLSLTQGTGLVPEEFFRALAEARATILTGISYDPRGQAVTGFEEFSEINGDSQRRLIFSFDDGKFGMYDTDANSTNEMLMILYRLQEQFGPLEKVVMCDRGMWDSAAWYRDGDTAKEVRLGHVTEDPSNRIIFYTEKK